MMNSVVLSLYLGTELNSNSATSFTGKNLHISQSGKLEKM